MWGRGLVRFAPSFGLGTSDSSATLALKRLLQQEMATKLSDLESAINSMVTHFHGSSSNGSTLNSTEFQTMISQQLPTFAKTLEADGGMGKALKMMGVEGDQNITFNNFWTLVHKQAVQVFKDSHKEPDTMCSCSLQ